MATLAIARRVVLPYRRILSTVVKYFILSVVADEIIGDVVHACYTIASDKRFATVVKVILSFVTTAKDDT